MTTLPIDVRTQLGLNGCSRSMPSNVAIASSVGWTSGDQRSMSQLSLVRKLLLGRSESSVEGRRFESMIAISRLQVAASRKSWQ